ncbi:MAG: hypothetical protein P8188_18225, partial [Gemmatimonadota bacterium]
MQVREMPEGFLGTVQEKWLRCGEEALTVGDDFDIAGELELPVLEGRAAQRRASDLLALKTLVPPDPPIHEWQEKHSVDDLCARCAGGLTTVTAPGRGGRADHDHQESG